MPGSLAEAVAALLAAPLRRIGEICRPRMPMRCGPRRRPPRRNRRPSGQSRAPSSTIAWARSSVADHAVRHDQRPAIAVPALRPGTTKLSSPADERHHAVARCFCRATASAVPHSAPLASSQPAAPAPAHRCRAAALRSPSSRIVSPSDHARAPRLNGAVSRTRKMSPPADRCRRTARQVVGPVATGRAAKMQPFEAAATPPDSLRFLPTSS